MKLQPCITAVGTQQADSAASISLTSWLILLDKLSSLSKLLNEVKYK